MKITNTRKTEMIMIGLYKDSKSKVQCKEVAIAKQTMKLILTCFEMISIFTNYNHVEIVKKLYFTRNNIMAIGLKRMEEVVYIQERTLLVYRKKYCEVVDFLFILIKQYKIME